MSTVTQAECEDRRGDIYKSTVPRWLFLALLGVLISIAGFGAGFAWHTDGRVDVVEAEHGHAVELLQEVRRKLDSVHDAVIRLEKNGGD